MSKIFLFHFEFFIAFTVAYLCVQSLIHLGMGKLTYARKYTAMKLVPGLCIVTLGGTVLLPGVPSPIPGGGFLPDGQLSSPINGSVPAALAGTSAMILVKWRDFMR